MGFLIISLIKPHQFKKTAKQNALARPIDIWLIYKQHKSLEDLKMYQKNFVDKSKRLVLCQSCKMINFIWQKTWISLDSEDVSVYKHREKDILYCWCYLYATFNATLYFLQVFVFTFHACIYLIFSSDTVHVHTQTLAQHETLSSHMHLKL